VRTCRLCEKEAVFISELLGLCPACAADGGEEAAGIAAQAHTRSREPFPLPARAPDDPAGRPCGYCANECRIPDGESGYCGVRTHRDGRIVGGDRSGGRVSWYHDPLPTNCVADWVCPGGSGTGHPEFSNAPGPEHGYSNLAVFYEACSFNCLYCQNWHYRRSGPGGPAVGAESPAPHVMAAAVEERTACICYFGGDPSCQIGHALEASRLAVDRAGAEGRVLRICWETNGSATPALLARAFDLSLRTGGCVKIDLKAWDESLHRILCGVSNRQTLENFRTLAARFGERPEPAPLVASTLMVPGYVDDGQVRKIARFIADLDKRIPYALLAFHPNFYMEDLPTTSRGQAEECLEAARAEGLERVRVGNLHLLRDE